MDNYSIKDLAEFSGIKQHTIRIWEHRYSFLQPARSETFRRKYSINDLSLLLNFSLLQKSGYKVSTIAGMSDEEKRNLIRKVKHTQHLQLKAINELIVYMAEMDTESFEMILESCIICWGIHETIRKVIIPFSERIGLLQKLETRGYVQNIYLIKESIKQKILQGIEKSSPDTKQESTVLLFLPPGEQQELQLIYLQYLLKTEGYRIIYLGKHISAEILEGIIRNKKPEFIITVLLEKKQRIELGQLVDSLPKILPQTLFVNLGEPLYSTAGNENYIHLDDPAELMEVLRNQLAD